MTSSPRLLPAAALALAVLLLGAPGAAAHTALVGADPEDGARLGAAPATLRLFFTEPLDGDLVRVQVEGPGGVDAPEPAVDAATITVPVTDGGPGTYTVSYRVVSEDGHPVSGRTTFTVKGPTATPTPAGTTIAGTPIAESPTTVTETPTTIAAAPAAAAGGGVRMVPLVGGLTVLAALGIGAALAAVRRRRSSA